MGNGEDGRLGRQRRQRRRPAARSTSRRRCVSCCWARTTAARSSTARNRLAGGAPQSGGLLSLLRALPAHSRPSFYELTAPAKHAPFDAGSPPSEFLDEVARLRASSSTTWTTTSTPAAPSASLYELLTALNRFADARQLEGAGKTEEAVAEFERGVLVLRELSSDPRVVPSAAGERTARARSWSMT